MRDRFSQHFDDCMKGGEVAAGRPRYVWFNGEIVPWEEAKIHVSTECARRGANVFEGIRAYWNESKQELYAFKMQEHFNRFFDSAKIMRLSIPYTHEELVAACLELLTRNEFGEDVHLRPSAYLGEGHFSYFGSDEISVGSFILAMPLASRLRMEKGIDCCVSSWVRISDNSHPPRVKSGSNYISARYAAIEARINGYDNAIILNDRGKVAEATDACLFIVRDGIPITPSVTSGILESITRATLIELFRTELRLTTLERDVDRTELYVAEEAFLCGTGAEICPIRSIDKYPVGNGDIGLLTKRIRSIYEGIVKGENPKYEGWLLPVYAR